MALTPKQQRFVDAYLISLNATEAARVAEYRHPNKQGPALLVNLGVSAAIAEAQAARREADRTAADRVIRELGRLAFSDLRQLVAWGPNGVTLRDSSSISDDDAAAVESVSQTMSQTGGSIKIKLHPKAPALKMLGDHLGTWEKPPPLEAILALLPAELADAIRRAAAAALPAG